MSNGLSYARRLRIDLAAEITLFESGVRRVWQESGRGNVDVTAQALAALRERFVQVDRMIAAFGAEHRAADRLCL